MSLPPLAATQRMEVTVAKGSRGVALTLKDVSYHIFLSLNNSLLHPQLSLPFSELQPKEAKRRAGVPILLYRSTSAQTVRKIESAI